MTNALRSVTLFGTPVPGVGDCYFTFPVKPLGTPGGGGRVVCGAWPVGEFWISGVEMYAWTNDPNAYAVMGAQQPDGDYISRRSLGNGSVDRVYAAGTAFYFPNDGVRELHLHCMCAAAKWLEAYCSVYFWQEP